jgi:hypothetical protein
MGVMAKCLLQYCEFFLIAQESRRLSPALLVHSAARKESAARKHAA